MSIFKILFVVGLAALAFAVYDILLYLFIAYIVMSAVTPLVDKWEARGLPRWVGALAVFLFVLMAFTVLVAISIPPFVSQTQNLIRETPAVLEKVINRFDLSVALDGLSIEVYLQKIAQDFSREIAAAPIGLLRVGAGIFGGVFDTITVFFFIFYMILGKQSIHQFFVLLIPMKNKKHLSQLVLAVDRRLGAWLRGQLVLMILIGVATFIGLQVIGMPFSLPLAVIAGLLEIVPIMGPVISAIPAVLVGLSISPAKALTAALLFLLIQQLENGVIVPRVMKHAVGLNPLVVIVALMVGGRLAGPMGALLAVPVTAVLMIVYHEWMVSRGTAETQG